MRILCLDVGTKRIGVAASDPLGLTAQPVCVISRRGGKTDFDQIKKKCDELSPEKIVVGMPYNEEGGMGPQAIKVKKFADAMTEYFSSIGYEISVEFWDERYSTVTAEDRLIEADVSREKRRRVIDKMAAVVILEEYLSSHEISSGAECESTEG